MMDRVACTCRGEGEVAAEAERAVEEGVVLLRGRFRRLRAHQHAADYLRGLVADVERKNGWQLAERAGYRQPRGIQRVLDRYAWDADAVRDDLRAYVVATLGDARAVLVVDETGFPKQGRHSVGVARQYCGTLGKRANCQIGVFLGYASPKGHAGIDRALYLPREWTEDRERARAAGAPDAIAWVAADEVYGADSKFRTPLEERGQAYVLAVRSNQPLSTWPPYGAPDQRTAASFAATIPADGWRRRSCGEGAQGPRLYDWAYLPARPAAHDGWVHGLLVPRRPERPDEVAFYLVYAPRDTPLAEFARVAGARWTIDDMFKLAKGQVGLDHYEVRSWQGWYRHITLALLAFAALAIATPQKRGLPPLPVRPISPSPSPRSVASWSASSGPPPDRRPALLPSPPGPTGVATTKRSRRTAIAVGA